MKLIRSRKTDTCSATISQTLWLMLACSALFVVTAYASAPLWWAGVGATNGSPTNNFAVVNQGQLKQFTTKAAVYLTTNGGTGSALSTLVSGWSNDYVAHGQAPSDFQAVNIGQLKYVANIVWSQLVASGYTNTVPLWLSTNSTDYNMATIGQLKTVFDFDLGSFSSTPQMTSPTTANGVTGTAFTYTFTASNVPTSMSVSGLPSELSVTTTTGMGGDAEAVVTGTFASPITFTLLLNASNGSGTGYGALAVNITPPVPTITSATTASVTAGSVFNYTITASDSPTSFSATPLPPGSLMPAGLSLTDTTTGLISGIPTTSGTYTIVLGATNANPESPGTTNLVLTVSSPSVPIITSPTTAEGTAGYEFSYTITASNSPTNVSASSVPLGLSDLGLSLDSGSGVLSGTLSTAGTYTVELGAANAGGLATPVYMHLNVHASGTPVIPNLTEYAFTGTAFHYTYTVSASSTPTFSVASGSLPSGLSLSSDGLISGTPMSYSTMSATLVSSTVSAVNGAGTGSGPLEFIVNLPVPSITSSTAVTTLTGNPFYYAIVASNSPTSFNATSLPAGLSINTNTGVIVGTPVTSTAATTYNVTLEAYNPNPSSPATTNLALTVDPPPLPVPVITSSKKATVPAGAAFTYTITASSVGTPTFTASSLPVGLSTLGLSLDSSSGVLSGIPTPAGTYTVIMNATDTVGTGTANLILNVISGSAPAITSTPTAKGIAGILFTYTYSATNSPTFSVSGLPLGLRLTTTSSTGVITGTTSVVGDSTVTLNAANGFGTAISTLTLTINPPLPVIGSPGTANGTFGVPFIPPYTITASNNPVGSESLNLPAFNATGLPIGLIVDTDSGLIAGTPLVSGTFTATLSASNEGGSGTKSLVFTIADWTSSQPNIGRSIASGDRHSVMLKTDGTVWAVGDDSYGELGDSGSTDTSSYGPVTAVTGFTGIIAVSAGGVTSMALDSGKHVWAWGSNSNGQLGDGTTTERHFPVQVVTSFGGSPLSNIVTIASGSGTVANGDAFNMALDKTGHVWTWGGNTDGELGNGTDGAGTSGADSHVPVEVTLSPGVYLSGIVAISAGANHAMALKSDGTVWTWGSDGNGQLGDGMSTSNVPVLVPSFSGITAISAGTFYSLALKNDGTVWAWGYNSDGELGNGMTGSDVDAPVQVMNLSNVVAISCGGDHALALKSDGTVWAWGNNVFNGLANGTTGGNSPIPVQISNLTGVLVLGAGAYQSTVLKGDGTIWGWGDNDWGSLPIEVGNRQSANAPIISATGSSPKTVTITTSITPGTIYYTLDGTEPTTNSLPYATPFSLSIGAVVNAAVFVDGVIASPVASSEIDISSSDSPPTATSVTATPAASPGEIDLTWSLSGQVNYSAVDIYRSDGGTYQLIATLDPSAASYTNSYHDTNVESTVSYQYEVVTHTSTADSTSSATSPPGGPTAPTTLDIYLTSPGGTTPLQ